MDDSYQKLLTYSLRLIAKKRYTEHELLTKLKRKKEGSKKDKDMVISRLKELNYIDDEIFAKDFIKTRSELSPRGSRMLSWELRRKGIKKESIEKTLEAAEINEEELISRLLERKKKSLSSLSRDKRRKKIISLLGSRGFNPSTIYKIIERC
ncbi:regulatory protein RecX [Patescibacteria group bacterium]